MTNPKNISTVESLRIRRVISATPESVFSAWTDSDALKKWWGPRDVRCLSAEIELQVGGQYRIENELPDGSVLWITGEYEVIERPHLLVYTWVVETVATIPERVSVRFEPHDIGTEIVLTHELISTAELSDRHRLGWIGCMEGLEDFLTRTATNRHLN